MAKYPGTQTIFQRFDGIRVFADAVLLHVGDDDALDMACSVLGNVVNESNPETIP